MRHDDQRVELELDRDVAERRLGERAGEGSEGEAHRPVRQAGGAPRGEPGEERQQDREEGDDPVRELDEGVVALLGERVPGRAARPVLAAEPRAGQPHGRAGGDDQDEPEHGPPRDLAEAGGRQLEGTPPRQRLRGGLRVHGPSVEPAGRG